MPTLAEQIQEHLERAGDTTPGAFNLAADIVDLCERETRGWTSRCDDAIRIPDMLWEAVQDLRQCANREETKP